MQLGTVFNGLNMPSLSEQVNIPVNPDPTAGMSYLSEHCIWHCRPNIHLSQDIAPFIGAGRFLQGFTIKKLKAAGKISKLNPKSHYFSKPIIKKIESKC